MRFHSRYWELPRPEDNYTKSELKHILQNDFSIQYSNLNTLKGHQLAELVARMQLGLPLYPDATNADLLAEIEAREPRQVPEGKANRQNLLHILDRLESERTFFRFVDLPPELRVRMYEFLFSFHDAGYHCQQPAIARTSRLVRNESLPVFYETNRFPFDISRIGRGFGSWPRQQMTEDWPFYIEEKHIAQMRHFEVKLYSEKSRLRIKIDLPSKASVATATAQGDGGSVAEDVWMEVWSMRPENVMTKHYLDICTHAVVAQMWPTIDRLLHDPGPGKWGTREVVQMALSAPETVRCIGAKSRVIFMV